MDFVCLAVLVLNVLLVAELLLHFLRQGLVGRLVHDQISAQRCRLKARGYIDNVSNRLAPFPCCITRGGSRAKPVFGNLVGDLRIVNHRQVLQALGQQESTLGITEMKEKPISRCIDQLIVTGLDLRFQQAECFIDVLSDGTPHFRRRLMARRFFQMRTRSV